jgi:UDP-glucose:(glucosyl)LPS alpha-1,2-glucosyltransferase
MPLAKDELSKNAMGGTELKKYALERDIKPELLDQFQIYVSRVHEPIDENKYRVLWIQDLAEDPESAHLANEGWRKFHKIVFVSNWQANAFINRFNIPWSRCVVLLNAVDPIEPKRDPDDDTIRIIYHTTPHRGLNLLLTVWDKLCETHPNIHLDLFSSFQIYGWAERDKEYATLFEYADKHPKITNHGSMPNDVVRDAVAKADIFAYPSTWTETSCMSLMEGMSAGLICVHPNLGALFETAANWTMMYQFHEDQHSHATLFYHMMSGAIGALNDPAMKAKIASQKGYADVFYNWKNRVLQWDALLTSIVNSGEQKGLPSQQFSYQIGPR